jgi:hypothetical protein
MLQREFIGNEVHVPKIGYEPSADIPTIDISEKFIDLGCIVIQDDMSEHEEDHSAQTVDLRRDLVVEIDELFE